MHSDILSNAISVYGLTPLCVMVGFVGLLCFQIMQKQSPVVLLMLFGTVAVVLQAMGVWQII